MTTPLIRGWVLGALFVLPGGLLAGEAPLGSKDFYPSPERPVGFRGDGNGYFPGATPVTSWQEGTLVQKALPGTRKPEPRTFVIDDKNPKNIVWKTAMPAWVNSHPIVVGDRVFTCGEPNLVICADAHTGKLLWTHRLSVFQAMGLDTATADRCQALAEMYHVLFDGREFFLLSLSKNADWKTGGETAVEMAGKVIPRIGAELKKVDPAGDYAAAVQETIVGYTALAEYFKSGNVSVKNTGVENDSIKKQTAVLLRPLKARIAALAKVKPEELALETPWGSMIGWQMAVPVSDGQFVYVSFGQGATACYDLTGKLIWAKYLPLAKGKGDSGRAQNTIQSPVLADGVLVDVHGGTKELVGLDAKTGAERWRVPTKGDFTFGPGGGYFVASHKIVALNGPDGKPVNVLVSSLCNIIRVRDGKILGALPYDVGGACGGPSIINAGDIVMKGMTGDAQNKPFVAYKLSFDGPDKVVGKEVWQLSRTPGNYHGQVATPKFCIFNSKDTVVDALTGKTIAGDRDFRGYSNLLIGNTFFWNHHASNWGDSRFEGLVTANIGTADFTDPAKPTVISKDNYIGGRNMPRCIEYEKYAPELLANDGFWGGWGGRPSHSTCADTVMFPSGNRLFLRTASHLYCIGDPHVKYDWNPASRPR